MLNKLVEITANRRKITFDGSIVLKVYLMQQNQLKIVKWLRKQIIIADQRKLDLNLCTINFGTKLVNCLHEFTFSVLQLPLNIKDHQLNIMQVRKYKMHDSQEILQ